MDALMSRAFQHRFADMFFPKATVDLCVGHMGAAERAVDALRALHPGIRVAHIFRNRGLMWIDVGYETMETEAYSVEVYEQIQQILSDATTLSAWSCAKDGNPGWLVDTAKGPTVLCPDCQKEMGLAVRRYEA